MNRNLEAALRLAAVTAVATGAAAMLIVPRPAGAAGDITIDSTPFVSTTTRAAVRAPLLDGSQFARDTEWVQQGNAAATFKSSVSRVEASDQYQMARGEVQALTGEDSGSMYLKLRPRANPAATMGAPAQ